MLLYGRKTPRISLNEFRFKCLEKGFHPKQTARNKLHDLAGVNVSSLPPCEAELAMHLKRARFVAKLWTNVHRAFINVNPSEKDGWQLTCQRYDSIWQEGDMLPPNLEINDNPGKEEDEETYTYEASSSDASCEDDG